MHDSARSDSYDTEGDVQGSDGSGSGGWALTGGGGVQIDTFTTGRYGTPLLQWDVVAVSFRQTAVQLV
jgi:hypothetical protein